MFDSLENKNICDTKLGISVYLSYDTHERFLYNRTDAKTVQGTLLNIVTKYLHPSRWDANDKQTNLHVQSNFLSLLN